MLPSGATGNYGGVQCVLISDLHKRATLDGRVMHGTLWLSRVDEKVDERSCLQMTTWHAIAAAEIVGLSLSNQPCAHSENRQTEEIGQWRQSALASRGHGQGRSHTVHGW